MLRIFVLITSQSGDLLRATRWPRNMKIPANLGEEAGICLAG